FRAFSGSGNRL
nr:Chain B, Peptide from Ubiquitin fusion degradation protein 1 homolog [Homo sapiens]